MNDRNEEEKGKLGNKGLRGEEIVGAMRGRLEHHKTTKSEKRSR